MAKLVDLVKVIDKYLYPKVREFIFVLANEDWKFCEVKIYRLSRKDVFKQKKAYRDFLCDAVNYDYVFQQIDDSIFNALIYPYSTIGGMING
ncbi:MAG: hypothetical protein J6A95_01760 [Clostridia bacterium]|nr:hypothetical protein [Clostridia bacterium]